MFAIIIVVSFIVGLSKSPSILNVVSIVLNFLWAATANYAYYLKEKK